MRYINTITITIFTNDVSYLKVVILLINEVADIFCLTTSPREAEFKPPFQRYIIILTLAVTVLKKKRAQTFVVIEPSFDLVSKI